MRTSAEERLMKHVTKTETCWLWTGTKHRQGYGRITTIKGKNDFTHRISYKKFKGSIPEGLEVLHTCDTPACVNPEHLVLGSHLDNMWDMLDKNRFPFQKLSIEDIQEIINLYKTGNYSQADLARKYEVDPSHICRIVHKQVRKFASQNMT